MEFKVDFNHLVYSISEILDNSNKKLVKHHRMVAVIAYNIAQNLDLSEDEHFYLFNSALLHDSGLVSMEFTHQVENLKFDFTDNINEHSFKGYELLKGLLGNNNIADIIRYHHVDWNNGREVFENNINRLANLVNLADRIAILIDQNREILEQKNNIIEKIRNYIGTKFSPEFINAFIVESKKDAFWFDAVYPEFLIDKIIQSKRFEYIIGRENLLEFCDVITNIIDCKSAFTARHSKDVGIVSYYIAKSAGLTDEQCDFIKIAGMLHDIGKIAVPVELLEKPAGLTEFEFNIIKSHIYFTFRILNKIKGLEMISQWAGYHHERLDGSGYPFKLTSADLSFESRVIMIADIFVAITEDRPYREGSDNDKALKILSELVILEKIDGDVYSILKNNIEKIDLSRKKDML